MHDAHRTQRGNTERKGTQSEVNQDNKRTFLIAIQIETTAKYSKCNRPLYFLLNVFCILNYSTQLLRGADLWEGVGGFETLAYKQVFRVTSIVSVYQMMLKC